MEMLSALIIIIETPHIDTCKDNKQNKYNAYTGTHRYIDI